MSRRDALHAKIDELAKNGVDQEKLDELRSLVDEDEVYDEGKEVLEADTDTDEEDAAEAVRIIAALERLAAPIPAREGWERPAAFQCEHGNPVKPRVQLWKKGFPVDYVAQGCCKDASVDGPAFEFPFDVPETVALLHVQESLEKLGIVAWLSAKGRV